MEDQEKTINEQVVDYLRGRLGDIVVISAISKKFKVGSAAMTKSLNELVEAGVIRKSNAKRTTGYYIPSPGQLNAERRAVQEVRIPQPLKVDRHRQELYDQLAANRSTLKSIG